MTLSTARAPRTLASAAIENGNPEFQVVSAIKDDSSTYYVVVVPRTVVRQGFTGWMYPLLATSGLKYTKFGKHLGRSLNNMEGVEATVGYEQSPHLVTIFVDNREQPRPLASSVLKGMPTDVAVAIQASLYSNNGPFQRFCEFLRRL